MFDLKKFRKANGLHQQQLADYLGVCQSYVSQMERGVRGVPQAVIEKILGNPSWTMYEESQEIICANPTEEVERLRREVEELKKEKAAYWDIICQLIKR